MAKERRLGRGLEALLGRPADASDAVAEPAAAVDIPADSLVWINVYDIDRNPYQPRQNFDETELQSLAESIREHGMLQPVVVRRVGDRFQLISGERRWRAATVAGWERISAQVREADDRQMAEVAIVENVQRKDLNALEKAVSFQRYLQEYGCTHEELASRVQVDRSTISNLIRLLELPGGVQQALGEGSISQGHARALLPLGDEGEQNAFCRRIQQEGLSVRATEEQVQAAIRSADDEPLRVIGSDGSSRPAAKTKSDHLASLEQELRSALGCKVEIKQAARGKGRIIVHFANAGEFERIHADLCGRDASERATA